MGTQDLFDFMKRINSEGDKFSWLEIHEFKYEVGLFGFKLRYNLTDDFTTN